MPFCHECGAETAPNASFCGGCGIAVHRIAPASDGTVEEGNAAMDLGAASGSSAGAGQSRGDQPDGDLGQELEDTETPDLDMTLVGQRLSELNQELPAAAGAPSEESAVKSADSQLDTTAGPGTMAPPPDEPEIVTIVRAPEAVPAEEVIDDESQIPTEGGDAEPALEEQVAVNGGSGSVEAPISSAEIAAPATVEDEPEPEPEPVKVVTAENAPAPPSVNLESTSAAGDKPRSAGQLKEGTILNGRYEIVRRVGGGGMGAVYLAKDRHLGDAPRAVKEMIQAHLDEAHQEKAIGDFKRESLLLTSLEHPAIPTIYDYFYDEGAARFYLVMKYISGGDFAARMRNAPAGRLDEKTVAQWGLEVADVLEYLHNRKPQIIYRDLKPANLMIDGNSGRVMLIDFGIARWVNKEEKGVTAVGTMGYAPPELFSGKVEPRSDVYSLGATMFHLLTGADPQDNPLLIFDFQKHPRPRQINPAMSVEMEHILMKAVEYKPEDRFHSAGEMGEVLGLHVERLRNGTVSYTPVAGPETPAASAETVFCGFCGGRIAAEDYFCAHCGAQQPLAGAGSTPLGAGRVTAKLVLAGTTELEFPAFVLQKDSSLVGRSDPQSNNFPEIDLTRFDPQTKVSRRHARIWRKGEMFLIEDLGSVNGTVLFSRGNDTIRLAPHQPRVLENGDRLRLGETMLNFVVG
jgi:serine/threonine-protein kinase